ncbi:unnamed protein product [Rotaria magnacalcarata]|uniref:VWFA domain-containing protein n=7 Tax=Rotaria magnacalcarata TaxID=392030 RepID=A0A816V8J7_9BILA|nr:unnamed protein product [Rotaria magnacalcarata]CAF2213770.1 unnamed protein product [Rotaria magnacalcarata]CAF4043728.1 unnamed protein product [Rotaria magnacalcarata]CAF4168834.1 unnamed protein product [Rotaria magnacalcarata]
MAAYLKLPLSNQQIYVEIKLSHPEATYNTTTAAAAGGDLDIICCVDVSGSMSGSPIKNVCEVLRDIYERTQKDYRLFTYNTQTDVKRTLKTLSERNDNLQASGGTSFACIFTAIKDYLMQNASAKKAITFIFMTDGQDNEPNGSALQKSVQMLKLMLSAMTNSPPITFHVIGFGEVNDAFLNKIRTFGTRQGLFRYSTESKELQNNFNDMFEYALHVRQFTIKFPNGKTYTANNIDNETVGFLANDDDDLSAMAELTLIDDKTTTTQFPLAPMKDIRAIHLLHALNLIQPENEEQVKSIQTYLNNIQITNSKNFAERLEAEQIYKEIDQRMMEYRQLFTQLKMTQVPERVKLQLSALRHDPIFANTQRKKKLDLRVYKNVDYFKKTNISGILQGYKDSITSDTWQKIREQKEIWVDTYSNEDIYEIMRKSPDNILCLGIFVQRDEEVINNPAKGLKLLKVTNTIISYDSFINGMNLARNNQQVQGQFTTLNDHYSIAGALADEQINAVIPLYINDEHMKRIRILEGIWLGYLYTLDSCGYDKQQEVALLKLFYEIIQQRTNTQRQKEIIIELEKVCRFIIDESQGFKTAEQFGEKTYEKLLKRLPIVSTQEYDLSIPLMIGYLRNDLTSVLVPIYYEYIRQEYLRKYPKNSATVKTIIENLVYGCDVKHLPATFSTNNSSTLTNNNLPDYIEKSFIDYFHDELSEPIQLTQENIIKENRKWMIHEEIELDYIKGLLLPLPDFIRTMLNLCQIDEDYIEKHLDYDTLRYELLITFYYLIYSDTNSGGLLNLPKKENILSVIDGRLQSEKERAVAHDYSESVHLVHLVSHVAKNCKTLEGFAGVMRKYCPSRRGPIFSEVFIRLVESYDEGEGDTVGTVTKKEKLIALLKNQISTTTATKVIYDDMDQCHSLPSLDEQLRSLRRFIDEKKVEQIGLQNRGRLVVYCRRTLLGDRQCRRKRNYRYFLNPFHEDSF